MPIIPLTHYIEPPRMMRATCHDFGYDHEVQVALPMSYHLTDAAYPVLWVMDGGMSFELATSIANGLALGGKGPDLIVVGVGQPRGTSFELFNERRLLDFCFMEDLGTDSLGDVSQWATQKGGKAEHFLSFLVDEVRPVIEAQYRVKADSHAITGGSGGGYFSTYALLTRPSAFDAYIIGSPPFYLGHRQIFDLEEQYAATHDDLRARVFFGAGEEEILEDGFLALNIVGSMMQMATTLKLRRYPSLEVTCRVFPDQNHVTVNPDLLQYGIRHLWANGPDVRDVAARVAGD